MTHPIILIQFDIKTFDIILNVFLFNYPQHFKYSTVTV